MDIKESVLEFLYKNNNGRLTNLYPVMLPFDNDRQGIRGTLLNLEKDGFIEIDNEYQKLIFQKASIPIPLSDITLLARLLSKGENYFKKHYLTKDKLKPSIKIKNLQNISNSTVNAAITQDSNQSHIESQFKKNITLKKEDKRIIVNVLIGIIITVISGIILYYIFGIS